MSKNIANIIDGVIRYFEHTSDKDVKVGAPFLLKTKITAMDYTGIIGISGPKKGCVYFTAPQILLKHLLKYRELDTEEYNIIDIVGELLILYRVMPVKNLARSL